jgi:uncharacterized protein (DUF849 family)
MKQKVIITCAVTGGGDTVHRNPAVPVTPKQIAESSIEAAKAGAAIAHIHVRDPKTGKASMDVALYRETVQRIRDSGCDVLLNLTAGVGANFAPGLDDPRAGGPGTTLVTPETRIEHLLELRPELCSLDMGTMNKGENLVFMNTPKQLRWMVKATQDAGVKPELEVFEAGHILLCKELIEEGLINAPPIFQICLGMQWLAPATPQAMIYMRDLLPAGAPWFTFGKALTAYPMVAQAVLLGGHIRVGFEDTLYLEEGVLAPSNGAIVEKAVKLIRLLAAEPATPAEARSLLGLNQQPAQSLARAVSGP